MEGCIPAADAASIPTEQAERAVLADILERAADLIEPEGRWTQGAEYRNASGEDISDIDESEDDAPVDREPVCWCAAGAIWAQPCPTAQKVVACEALARAIGKDERFAVPGWNDAPERTQAEVVAALRAAAEKARTATETGSVGMEPQSGGMRP